MTSKFSFEELSEKCVDIIKNNDPKKSIDLISNIEYLKNNKLGMNNALKIYKTYAGESSNYDTKKNQKKISPYVKEVKKNKSKAELYVNSK